MVDKVELAAMAAHEMNRLYCMSLGDNSQVHWEDSPEWQRKSAIEGAKKAFDGATSEQLHQSWVDFKLTDGWKYGPVKDPEKKEHPCMVPYHELPFQQRKKDYIFGDTVRTVLEYFS